MMFDFAIINTEDGNQLIDRRATTPYWMLTPLEMMEYIAVEEQITFMDWQERKAAERQRRHEESPLYSIACVFRLIR